MNADGILCPQPVKRANRCHGMHLGMGDLPAPAAGSSYGCTSEEMIPGTRDLMEITYLCVPGKGKFDNISGP